MRRIEDPEASDRPAPRRGRPRGSVSLADEKEDEVILLLRGGASLRSAAETAEIPIRTLQGWLARGEGRSAESATPKLRAFAKNVRKAQAEARASAEVRVHQNQPATWLRTEAGNASEPEDASGTHTPSPERIKDLARRLRDVLLLVDASEVVPPCPNARCRCIFHRERTPEELAATRATASKRGGS
jgi:hypothetical protein